MEIEDAEFVVDEGELEGEEVEDEQENDPDKPMYPPLTLGTESVCFKIHCFKKLSIKN
jgi:hypothetical protein